MLYTHNISLFQQLSLVRAYARTRVSEAGFHVLSSSNATLKSDALPMRRTDQYEKVKNHGFFRRAWIRWALTTAAASNVSYALS